MEDDVGRLGIAGRELGPDEDPVVVGVGHGQSGSVGAGAHRPVHLVASGSRLVGGEVGLAQHQVGCLTAVGGWRVPDENPVVEDVGHHQTGPVARQARRAVELERPTGVVEPEGRQGDVGVLRRGEESRRASRSSRVRGRRVGDHDALVWHVLVRAGLVRILRLAAIDRFGPGAAPTDLQGIRRNLQVGQALGGQVVLGSTGGLAVPDRPQEGSTDLVDHALVKACRSRTLAAQQCHGDVGRVRSPCSLDVGRPTTGPVRLGGPTRVIRRWRGRLVRRSPTGSRPVRGWAHALAHGSFLIGLRLPGSQLLVQLLAEHPDQAIPEGQVARGEGVVESRSGSWVRGERCKGGTRRQGGGRGQGGCRKGGHRRGCCRRRRRRRLCGRGGRSRRGARGHRRGQRGGTNRRS